MKSPRRCLLFTPGNNPAMILASRAFGADAVILDLEDAVATSQKDAARRLVIEALSVLDLRGVESIVRINPLGTPYGRADLEVVVASGADTLLLAKADPESLEEVAAAIDAAHSKLGILALIETALGMECAFDCARIKHVDGLLFGAEDFTADLGTQRSADGLEIMYGRQRIVVAAAAAGVDSIDTPFTGLDAGPDFDQDVMMSRKLGFTGKACINPRHIEGIIRLMSPGSAEIETARRVLGAAIDAEKKGLGAVSLDGRMIDAPIVARARKTLMRAGIVDSAASAGSREGS